MHIVYGYFAENKCLYVGQTYKYETKEKISISKTGRTHTQETKITMSNAHKGKIFTQGHRNNMVIAWKERKRKMAEKEPYLQMKLPI